MKIEFKNGLLYTSIEVTYNNKSKIINNMVIDTGAENTLISQESVEDIGLKYSLNDRLTTTYGIGGEEVTFIKNVDKIKVGDFESCNVNLDVTGFLYEDINGLIGLDILLKAGFVLDLDELKMCRKNKA